MKIIKLKLRNLAYKFNDQSLQISNQILKYFSSQMSANVLSLYCLFCNELPPDNSLYIHYHNYLKSIKKVKKIFTTESFYNRLIQ